MMSGTLTRPAAEPMAHALVLLHRYTVVLTEVAANSLGNDRTGNRDIQFLLTIQLAGPLSPTRLAQLTGASRNTVARSLERLSSAGWISRSPDPRDGRSVMIKLTPNGSRRIHVFKSLVSDLFVSEQPLVKEVLDIVDLDPDPSSLPASFSVDDAVIAMALAGARFVVDVRDALAPFGPLDASDRFTLALLYARGTQRPGQLAEELRFAPSGMSGVLARLEDAALISRTHDHRPDDRRAVLVTLTPRGRSAANIMVEVCGQHAAEIGAALTLMLSATHSSAST